MTINVTKYRLNPDRIFAGTRGSFGMEKLSFDFGDGWDFDTISVTFHPQRGKPIKVPILPGTEIDIPAEVMEHSGESRFVVSGRAVGEDGTIERQAITLEGYVDVAYTADEKGGNTRKVTPDMYDQLIDQASKIFDEAREDVSHLATEAEESASDAEGFANSAEEDASAAEKSASAAETAEQAASKSAGEAKTAADTAAGAASNAAQSADAATSAASAAKASATAAENSRKSVEQIAEGIPETVQETLQQAKDSGEFDGADGYSPTAKAERVENGVRVTIADKDGTTSEVVQDGESGVHVGSDAPPAGTRVWFNPDGKRTKIPQVDESLTQAGYAADAAKVGEKINQLSGEIADLAAEDCNSAKWWEQGSLNNGHGRPATSPLRLRTINYLSPVVAKVYTDYPYSFCVYGYDSSDTFIGIWNGSGFVKSTYTWITSFDFSKVANFGYKYKLIFRRNNDATVTPDDSYSYIHFTNSVFAEIESVRTEFNGKTDELFDAVAGDMNNAALWERGGIKGDGSEYGATYVIRTVNYVPDNVKLIYSGGNYRFIAFLYDDAGVFVGTWGITGVVQTADKWLNYLVTEHLGYKIRLMVQRGDRTDITPAASVGNIHFLNDTQAKLFYPKPTLTFIDDDGSLNALQNWESITDEIGVKITSALVTGVMGDGEANSQKASWADVARLQNKGYEFISHTHNHIDVSDRTNEVVIEQFESSIAALREHGCESRYLVYPYNSVNSEKLPLVKKYFTAAVGLGQETENILPIQTHDLKRISINSDELIDKEYNGESVQVAEFRTLAALKWCVDRTLINGGWLIIMTHLRNDEAFYHDEKSRAMIIDLCKYAVEKGMLIQTFGEAFQRYKNIMETGTVNDSTYYITDCNGVVRYR